MLFCCACCSHNTKNNLASKVVEISGAVYDGDYLTAVKENAEKVGTFSLVRITDDKSVTKKANKVLVAPAPVGEPPVAAATPAANTAADTSGKKQCTELHDTHKVVPGQSWGSLNTEQIETWKQNRYVIHVYIRSACLYPFSLKGEWLASSPVLHKGIRWPPIQLSKERLGWAPFHFL